MKTMPISDESKANNKLDYKQKYNNLKRKLKLLIYENECYSSELRKSERQLLQVSRDKSFLLDRLLQYENIDSSTSDSDDTLSSDTDNDQRKNEHNSKKKKAPEPLPEPQPMPNNPKKKKTTNQSNASRVKTASSGKPSKPVSLPSASNSLVTANPITPLIKIESAVLAACSQSSIASSNSSVPSTPDGHMTAEELERHLESRRQPMAMLMPEKTPLTVPVELFSNESSGLPDDDNNLNLKLMQH